MRSVEQREPAAPRDRREASKGAVKFALRLALTVILLGFILWKSGGAAEVGRLIAGIDPGFAALALAAITSDRVLMTYKWIRLLRCRGVHISLLYGMRIYCASMVWGLFLPATMGADVIRAYSTSRSGLDSNEVVASIIIERMVGFLSALLLGMACLALLASGGYLDRRFNLAWWAGGAMLLAGVFAFAASFNRQIYHLFHDRLLKKFSENKLLQRLRQFHDTYLAYQDERAELGIFFGLSLIEQLMPILITWLIALGLGVRLSLLYLAGVVPLTMLVSRIPITIDGLGVYDGIFAFLLSLAGIPPAQAVAITLAGRIVQTAAWLPWWAAQVIASGNLRPPEQIHAERMLEKKPEEVG